MKEKSFIKGNVIVLDERILVIFLVLGLSIVLRFFWNVGFTIHTLELLMVGLGFCIVGGLLGSFAEIYREKMKKQGYVLTRSKQWCKQKATNIQEGVIPHDKFRNSKQDCRKGIQGKRRKGNLRRVVDCRPIPRVQRVGRRAYS
jgi:hypothetical protein